MNCAQCHKPFPVLAEDRRFYQKFSVPPPTLCPDCRMQRRMVWRNERIFYHRACDLCHRSIVSMYPAGTPHPVYCSSCYWSDSWDAAIHGITFDFTRPFFDQFSELLRRVPREALVNVASENCEFNNHCRFSKNCYLCSLIGNSEECYYSYWIWDSKSIINSAYINQSQYCADSFHLLRCYECVHCVDGVDCSSCAFSYDLTNCQDCLFSWNLKNQRYRIFNQPCSPEDFKRILCNLRKGSWQFFEKAKQEFHEKVLAQAIRRYAWIIRSEQATGDHLIDCNRVHHTFDAVDTEDIRYCTSLLHVEDAMDCYSIGIKPSELIYESCVSRETNRNIKFTNNIFSSQNIEYSDSVMQSKDCFGCCGLRNKQYCILNKQYSKEDYSDLKSQILNLMQKTGEWGQFFPITLAPFAYNETVAMDYYPLDREQARSLGARWQEQKSEVNIPLEANPIESRELPDSIQETDPSICDRIVLCQQSRRPYRITRQELALYKILSLPLPRTHPDVRHLERLKYRNPRALFRRLCSKCAGEVASPFPATSAATIYCENCYLNLFK